MEKTDARAYLISKGFNPGKRGRFSTEMLTVLKDSGLTFERSIKAIDNPSPRGANATVNLK